ncbi:hypothetical protein KBX26_06410 [Micromonospora sp. C97]|nr:hypothetical protein [Micromonospora sp. C97]MBQ1029639.1 hypothetical protein [Micromonospora sp. C97]
MKTIGAHDVTIILRGVDRYGLAPSHASRLVQAVDLVTFLYRRMVNGTGHDPGEAAANEKLWSWVEQRRYPLLVLVAHSPPDARRARVSGPLRRLREPSSESLLHHPG